MLLDSKSVLVQGTLQCSTTNLLSHHLPEGHTGFLNTRPELQQTDMKVECTSKEYTQWQPKYPPGSDSSKSRNRTQWKSFRRGLEQITEHGFMESGHIISKETEMKREMPFKARHVQKSKAEVRNREDGSRRLCNTNPQKFKGRKRNNKRRINNSTSKRRNPNWILSQSLNYSRLLSSKLDWWHCTHLGTFYNSFQFLSDYGGRWWEFFTFLEDSSNTYTE